MIILRRRTSNKLRYNRIYNCLFDSTNVKFSIYPSQRRNIQLKVSETQLLRSSIPLSSSHDYGSWEQICCDVYGNLIFLTGWTKGSEAQLSISATQIYSCVLRFRNSCKINQKHSIVKEPFLQGTRRYVMVNIRIGMGSLLPPLPHQRYNNLPSEKLTDSFYSHHPTKIFISLVRLRLSKVSLVNTEMTRGSRGWKLFRMIAAASCPQNIRGISP